MSFAQDLIGGTILNLTNKLKKKISELNIFRSTAPNAPQVKQLEKEISDIQNNINTASQKRQSLNVDPLDPNQASDNFGNISERGRTNTDESIARVKQNFGDYIASEQNNIKAVKEGIGLNAANTQAVLQSAVTKAGLPVQASAGSVSQFNSNVGEKISNAQTLSDQKILAARDALENKILTLQSQDFQNDVNIANQLINAQNQYQAVNKYIEEQGKKSETKKTPVTAATPVATPTHDSNPTDTGIVETDLDKKVKQLQDAIKTFEELLKKPDESEQSKELYKSEIGKAKANIEKLTNTPVTSIF